MAIDQSAAYDIVCHQILKRKLEHIGIEKDSVELLMDYLTERKQLVEINSQKSDTIQYVIVNRYA